MLEISQCTDRLTTKPAPTAKAKNFCLQHILTFLAVAIYQKTQAIDSLVLSKNI
jgi:hypothetical protein